MAWDFSRSYVLSRIYYNKLILFAYNDYFISLYDM